MDEYCAFSKDHKCLKWEDYELTRHELEEADDLCHSNWIEIQQLQKYITTLKALKDFFAKRLFTVFSRIFYEVVQQIVQLNTLKVNLFVGKPTERFFVLGQFIGKLIVDRIGKTYLLLLEYIGIDVRRNAYIAVSEVFGDHFQVYSAVQQKRSVAMSQLM